MKGTEYRSQIRCWAALHSIRSDVNRWIGWRAPAVYRREYLRTIIGSKRLKTETFLWCATKVQPACTRFRLRGLTRRSKMAHY